MHPPIINKLMNTAKWRAGRISLSLRSGHLSCDGAVKQAMESFISKPFALSVVNGCIIGSLIEAGHADLAENYIRALARMSDERDE